MRWIAGPVLHAVTQGPFSLRESVRVGPQALLGEVVRIHDDQIVVQVYEDTTGLRPGIEVHGDGQPLAIRLGPGLLGHIFDGLLRPLSGTGTAFVQPGMRTAAAGRRHFEPRIAVGALLAPGAVIGEAGGGGPHGRAQRCLAPPDVSGVVESVVAPGEYADDATVCVLRQGDGRAARARDEPRLAGAHAAAGARGACRRWRRWSPASASSTACSRWRRAARRRSPAASAPARRCCSKRWPRAATPTSSSTSAAASAATRWPACSTSSRP